tara:strand:+ start:594 stop:1010 length:417 start_codon:yes stop_codon:yes gene_type:complete
MNKQDIKKTKNEFKTFCTKYNLRYKLDESFDPVSPTRKKNCDDHLYCLYKEGYVGAYIERETIRSYNYTKKKLVDMGCKVLQDGDLEGTFSIAKNKATKVARFLKTSKNQMSKKRRKEARERMKALWESGKMKREKSS